MCHSKQCGADIQKMRPRLSRLLYSKVQAGSRNTGSYGGLGARQGERKRERELVADSGLCDQLINTTGALTEQIAFSLHCDYTATYTHTRTHKWLWDCVCDTVSESLLRWCVGNQRLAIAARPQTSFPLWRRVLQRHHGCMHAHVILVITLAETKRLW